ncbi:hypothetical protein TUM20985_00720 [Mycobacterium antarcticum]|nr:hypothetical protein TUM20985_00720 [Mycolicibacterium sp. TUM20985]GLP78671.1 hypothetical protein TUM20984_00910 [Mycolicibacterium sp. TUM20984]
MTSNLMTAGAGICHSEVSSPSAPILHGVQLWVALLIMWWNFVGRTHDEIVRSAVSGRSTTTALVPSTAIRVDACPRHPCRTPPCFPAPTPDPTQPLTRGAP